MSHNEMDGGHSEMDHSKMDHSKMDHSKMDHSHMDHGMSGMDHSMHMGNFKQKFWLSLGFSNPDYSFIPYDGA